MGINEYFGKSINLTKLRKYIIINCLFNHNRTSYQELSDKFMISKSSISNDFKWIKKVLKKNEIKLVYDNSGTFIKGTESKIQKAILSILITNNEEDISEVFIDLKMCKCIKEIILVNFNEYDVSISDNDLRLIYLSISILVSRGIKGFKINQKNENKIEIAEELKLQMYPIMYEIMKEIQDENIYNFSNDEIKYLSKILFSSGIRYLISVEKIPNEILEVVNELIESVSYNLQIDLSKDTQLVSDLSAHIYQTSLRNLENIEAPNPFLDEIKNNYSSLYGFVWLAVKNLDNTYVNFSDDEIGFITLHFLVSIERNISINKIVYLCPYGIGMSNLAKTKLSNIFSEIDYFEVISFNEIERYDFSEVDLIISSIDVKIPNNIMKNCDNIIYVSPLISTKDLHNIMESYISLVNKKKKLSVVSNITNNKIDILYKNINKTTTEKIYKYIYKILEEISYDTEKYLESMMNREKLQSTYIGNGVIIPHGYPTLIKKSKIIVFNLNSKIDWFGNSADLLIFLFINKDDSKLLGPFMQELIRGLENKKDFIKKLIDNGRDLDNLFK